MRYERMALALGASALAFLVCFQFSSMAVGAASAVANASDSLSNPQALRFFALAVASLGFGFFGVSFLLLASIKAQLFQTGKYRRIGTALRLGGLTFLWLAIAMIVPWTVVQLAT